MWNQVVADVGFKLEEAKRRVAELESAIRAFKRNADKGEPIPGEPTQSVATPLPLNEQQHSISDTTDGSENRETHSTSPGRVVQRTAAITPFNPRVPHLQS